MGGKETGCFSPRFLIRRRRSSEGRKTFSSRMIWRSELSEGCLPLGASSSVERAFNRLLFVALGRGGGGGLFPQASLRRRKKGPENRRPCSSLSCSPPSSKLFHLISFSLLPMGESRLRFPRGSGGLGGREGGLKERETTTLFCFFFFSLAPKGFCLLPPSPVVL